MLVLFLFITNFLNAKNVNDTIILHIAPEKFQYKNDIQKQFDKLDGANNFKIIVHKGSYNIRETLFIRKGNVKIQFERESTFDSDNNDKGIISVEANNVIIEGGRFNGNGVSSTNYYKGFGIRAIGVNNVVIKNNIFNNISGNSIVFFSKDDKIGCSNNKVFNNKIVNPVFHFLNSGDEAGIIFGYSGNGYFHNNNIIENNFVDGNNILNVGIGIIAHGRNNIIKNNIVKNCLAYGILAYESSYVNYTLSETKVLYNNVSNIGEIGLKTTNKGMGIYLMKSHNSIIEGNVVDNVMRNSNLSETLISGGISSSGGENIIISHNAIRNSAMYGIAISYGFNSEIFDNIIDGTKKSAIKIEHSNDVNIISNVFKNNKEVTIKGFFGNTSNKIYYQNQLLAKYQNISTGKNINIEKNTFYYPSYLISFIGDSPQNNYEGNSIEKFIFKKNLIISNIKNINDSIGLRNVEKKVIYSNEVRIK